MSTTDAAHPVGDYEDVTKFGLDADLEEQLLGAHNECTFIWSNNEGWPVGVIMSYVWRNGGFWRTASGQRARISAVRRDPRVCVVVTSTGLPLPRNKAITWKGTARCSKTARPRVVLPGARAGAARARYRRRRAVREVPRLTASRRSVRRSHAEDRIRRCQDGEERVGLERVPSCDDEDVDLGSGGVRPARPSPIRP